MINAVTNIPHHDKIFNVLLQCWGRGQWFIDLIFWSAEAWTTANNWITTMTADALAPGVVKPSAAMVLIMQDKTGPCLSQGRMSTLCAISVIRNDFYFFFPISSGRQDNDRLSTGYSWILSVNHTVLSSKVSHSSKSIWTLSLKPESQASGSSSWIQHL